MIHGTLNGSVFTKREHEHQKLRMGGGSWSINLEELPAGTRTIRYITKTNHYTISTDDAFTYGFTRTLGGERKLIVPLNRWKKGII